MKVGAHELGLFIGGKLRFPTNSTSLVRIRVKKARSYVRAGRRTGKKVKVVRFVESMTRGWSITREVLAADVSAIFLPNTVEDPLGDDEWWTRGTWFRGAELANTPRPFRNKKLGQKRAAASSKERYGYVYVAPNVSMLSRVSFASSAADSIDYGPYPYDERKSCTRIPGPSLGDCP